LSARGHKAPESDIKCDASTFALSKTFKGWIADKEEAITKREDKRRREKEATCNKFFDLTKKAIGIEDNMAKAKALEAEAKQMAKEREIMFIDTTNMTEGKRLGWRSGLPSSDNATSDRA
jgi:hypothetical protein